MNHYYNTLELAPNATPEQVKARYKLLVRIYHPDRYRTDADKHYVEERLAEVNQAYKALIDTPQTFRSNMLRTRSTRHVTLHQRHSDHGPPSYIDGSDNDYFNSDYFNSDYFDIEQPDISEQDHKVSTNTMGNDRLSSASWIAPGAMPHVMTMAIALVVVSLSIVGFIELPSFLSEPDSVSASTIPASSRASTNQSSNAPLFDDMIANATQGPASGQIIFTVNENHNQVIYVADASDLSTHSLNINGWSPVWSPDNRYIAYIANDAEGVNQIYRLDTKNNILGKLPTQLTNTAGPKSNLAWSPDGRLIAFINGDGHELVDIFETQNTTGMKTESLNALPSTETKATVVESFYLESLERVELYAALGMDHIDTSNFEQNIAELDALNETNLDSQHGYTNLQTPRSILQIVDVKSHDVHTLTDETQGTVHHFVWHPDSQRLLYDLYSAGDSIGGSRIYQINIDRTARLALTDFVGWKPTISTDGSQLGIGTNSGLYLYDFNETALNDTALNDTALMVENSQQIQHLNGYSILSMGWSFDNTKIAFLSDYSAQRPHLWIMDIDGQNFARLSNDEILDYAWSPSGNQIAYITGSETKGESFADVESLVTGRIVGDMTETLSRAKVGSTGTFYLWLVTLGEEPTLIAEVNEPHITWTY
ncbi:MAG: DnaJ domain-containing protein [Chloroflexota bacterium]